MKILKQILFTFVAVAGLSLAVSAQKGGGQQRPPKEKPPVIKPGDKPKNPPKENRPKKPGMSYFVALVNENEYSG
jgi:hypothetical protein